MFYTNTHEVLLRYLMYKNNAYNGKKTNQIAFFLIDFDLLHSSVLHSQTWTDASLLLEDQ